MTNLQLKNTGNRAITLKWTAPGDDCNTGNATSWEVRWSASTITDTNWQSAAVANSGDSATNGNDDCAEITYPAGCPTRYFVVFVFDEVGNRSPISNVFSYAPACSGSTIPVCP